MKTVHIFVVLTLGLIPALSAQNQGAEVCPPEPDAPSATPVHFELKPTVVNAPGGMRVVLESSLEQLKLEDEFVYNFGDNPVPITKVLKWASEAYGLPIHYQQQMIQHYPGLSMSGEIHVKKEAAASFWESILASEGFRLEIAEVAGTRYLRLTPGSSVGAQAGGMQFVSPDELDEWATRPHDVIATTFTVQHARASGVAQAVAQLQGRQRESMIREVVGTNTVIVRGRAQDVLTARRLIQTIDVPPRQESVQLRSFSAGRLDAHTTVALINSLLGLNRGPQAMPTQATSGADLGKLKIVADGELNRVLVRGYPSQIEEVSKIIKEMRDTEGSESPVVVAMAALKYANASEVVAAVRELTRARRNRTGDTGGATVTADQRTNSVLIQGSEKFVSRIQKIISSLDVEQK